jgi:hypothetical protein
MAEFGARSEISVEQWKRLRKIKAIGLGDRREARELVGQGEKRAGGVGWNLEM